MVLAKDLRMRDGRLANWARRFGLALSLGCLVAAAGMAVVFLAREVREMERRAACRRNLEQIAAAQKGAQQRWPAQHDGPITVQSLRQSAEHGMLIYDGDVRVDVPAFSLACQHVQREADGRDGQIRLAGYGGVAIRGIRKFPRLKADNFVFDSHAGGLLTLAGDVQVEGPEGPQKYRLCSIALGDPAAEARIVKSKSLLDDFAASQTTLRKLALLDDIAAVYRDDELPPEASWLLAMKLLQPHLTWHKEPRAGSGEHGKASLEAMVAADWPEAHAGEPWMREDAGYWRLDERRHVDVLHAVKLLARPGADAAEDERRKRWRAEIERNNTLLRMIVAPLYRPRQAAVVTLDVCNADRLTLGLYRVGNGAAWAAVRLRQGRDFLYADAKAHFTALAETTAGPKKLNQLMDNLVVQWTAVASELPRNESWAQQRPAPQRGTAWNGNLKLAISAEYLAKPGYYVLAVEANGETAFAPIRVEDGKPGG